MTKNSVKVVAIFIWESYVFHEFVQGQRVTNKKMSLYFKCAEKRKTGMLHNSVKSVICHAMRLLCVVLFHGG